MTSYTKTLMLAAAACALAAGNAAAQTYHAEIPFSFRAGQTMLAAGSYDVRIQGGVNKMLLLRNVDTKKAILVTPKSITGEWKGAAVPNLRFACASRCSLESMWVGGYEGAYTFHMPRVEANETARVTTVGLTLAKGD
jgi:hypothetical protein